MDNVTLIRVVAGLMVFCFVIPLYFLPSLLARKKRQWTAIFALNLLLGWTLLGWVGALVWALTAEAPETHAGSQPVSVLCSACGKYTHAGAQFCSNCGQSLSAKAALRAVSG